MLQIKKITEGEHSFGITYFASDKKDIYYLVFILHNIVFAQASVLIDIEDIYKEVQIPYGENEIIFYEEKGHLPGERGEFHFLIK